MTDKPLTTLPAQTPTALLDARTRRTRSEPGRVTGRLKRAIDAMIHDGLTDNQAAVKFKMTVQAIRLGLKRAHVRRYQREQLEVFHARELGRHYHALIDVRDGTNEVARVNATRTLLQLSETDEAQARKSEAGVGIVIIVGKEQPQQPAPVTIKRQPYQPPARPEPLQIEHEPINVVEKLPIDQRPSDEPLSRAFVETSRRLAPADMAGIADNAPKQRPGVGHRGARRRVTDD